ncbi:conserved unknown protein [Ectocarpus siliculosus]|uniref:Transcriptional coactivator p15 (PC4) C-terminal domain-containing protein n=1 Tax=Ectocarpus siliculosus TaxID=2880 RepID=D7FR01_ECTSI|nr:conserved unknown protein [Ectocarpus siliculosus]|eukprot:CBJ26155.1 conserved unknown protein [Ectocarpus siliculosus]
MPKRKADEEGSGGEEEERGATTTDDGETGKRSSANTGAAAGSSSGSSSKKAKKQSDGSGVSNKIELGNKKFVDVREFKGKIYVDIREYYEKDGEMRPGKKGISLSTEHWEVLKENMDDINAKVEELSG